MTAAGAVSAGQLVRRRVPGSVAEIDGSPQGPSVGAFFDFDGTLIAGYSASAVAAERVRRRELGPVDVARTVTAGFRFALGQADFADLLELTADGWRGRSVGDMHDLGERLYERAIRDRVYPEAREIVAAHQRRGHTVVLTSSATRYQVGAVARDLGIRHVVCSELEAEDGVLTGKVVRPVPWAAGKASAVQAFAAAHGLSLGQSYFYADGNEDVALMHLVGKPRPTNPGRRLEQVARRRGWPVQRFPSRGRTGAALRARNLAAVASLAPVAGIATAVALVRRDRRAGMNLVSELGLDALLSLTGVRLEVTGEEHLRSHRPAVFLFSHGAAVDRVVAARLVRCDYASVVGGRLAGNRLAGGAGRLADVVFADAAVEGAEAAAAPLAELLTGRKLSVLAPCDRGERVGAAGEAAVRAAVAARVPVVPIAIRGTDRLGPPGATALRPGFVEVEALPPVHVEEWAAEDVPAGVESMRQSLAHALAERRA